MSGPREGVQASEALPRAGKKRRVWRILIAVAVVIVVGLLLPLINLGRYHRTISESLARALGHQVSLGSVNLTLFPLPGLVIHNFAVEEDPAFGAEPLLLAPEVTVYPRLSSLWRERLEIGRIDLENASVNLAQDSDGRWNFSSLLLQASRTATAPTGQRHPSATPRFPYIEFSGARINFKEGEEKKAFSFLNADVSVWLADANRWRIRFEAQPVRTDLDLDLADTGTVKLDGVVTRAESLDQLPLKLHVEWTGAQMGQVSRMVLGEDSGWRGDLRADADITGDMRDLTLRSRLRVADAHRLEFTPLTHFNIDTRCNAEFHHPQRSLDNLTCLWPTGDGHLLLTGAVPDVTNPKPKLKLEINHTPVSFVVDLLGLMRRGLPGVVDAKGTINGEFDWGPSSAKASLTAPADALTGQAVADTVSLQLANVDHPFTFATLRFATPSEIEKPGKRVRHGRRRRTSKRGPVHLAATSGQNVVLLEPATFDAGAATPTVVSGQFSRAGFSLHLGGESSVARILPLARDFSQLSAFDGLAAKGTAQANLTFAGPWIPPVNPDGTSAKERAQGWVRLQHVQVQPKWLPEPVEIATATAQLGGQNITWANASISVRGIAAKGSVSYPATCADPAGCAAEVNLDFPSLNVAELARALLGEGHGRFITAILSRVESAPPPWPVLNGTLHAGTLTVGELQLTNASAAIAVRDHKLNILSLDANGLGGSAHATGEITKTDGGPQYALNITASGVKLAEAGALFRENWGTGTMDGQMDLTLRGTSDLASSATGDFRFLVNGTWGGSWKGARPGEVSRRRTQWTATGTIGNKALTLTQGPARGTIGFNRKLNLEWTGALREAQVAEKGPAPIRISGTLAHPVESTAKRATLARASH